MGSTCLALIQSACYASGAQTVPSAVASPTDFSTLQLKELLYEVCRELRQARRWPQLIKKYSVILQPGRSRYQLPPDFYSSVPNTHWDQGNKWQMQGPFAPSEWNYRLYGYVTVENRKAFRVYGPDINPNSAGGQFYVNPTPSEAQAGVRITFEYITRSYFVPQLWTPSTSYGASASVFCDGNIYTKGGGTATSNIYPMTMAWGEGRDGGVHWTVIEPSAWGGSTAYSAGDYVLNSSKLYLCTSGGVSAGSGGPTTTEEEITDGTVTWQYCATPLWTAETDYEAGTYMKTSTPNYYLNTTPGPQGNGTSKSGKREPSWNVSSGIYTESDGTITWTHTTAAKETVSADTDLCLFDDELVIKGLTWRLLRSKRMDYADIQGEYEQMKSTALARWDPGMRISLAGGGYVPGVTNANIPEGNFTF